MIVRKATVWRFLLLAASSFVGGKATAADTHLIDSFEAPQDLQKIKTKNARLVSVREHATDGSYALRVDFEANGQPMIELAPAIADFRPFGCLTFDAMNPAAEPLSFFLQVEDASGDRTIGQTLLPLRAGESARFALALNSPSPMHMGMRGGPTIPGFRLLGSDHHAVDAEHIAAIRFFIAKPDVTRSLILDNLRLARGVSYDKIVDAFGQYTREDWPGKLRSESELAARLTEEHARLDAHPSLEGRDIYGAWSSGPPQEATGFFRTKKSRGKWWLVAPNGHLFFSLGMNSVNFTEGGTVIEGRESMFSAPPAAGDPLAAHFGTWPRDWVLWGLRAIFPEFKGYFGRSFNFYAANLHRKYGDGWKNKWQETALARLRNWGINTIGNWSDPALCAAHQIPYTVTLDIRGQTARLTAGPGSFGQMRDVYDPQFELVVEQSLGAVASAKRNDPWVVGYFVDNELGWGNMRNDRARYGLALGALMQGNGSAAKRAFLEQLKSRYEAIEHLNEAWGATFRSWEELLTKVYNPQGEWKPGLKEDLGIFMKEFARRYFRIVHDALKKHDPNHLYLGSRFAGHTREEVEACAEYCDVISFNIYRPRLNAAEWSVLDGIDKPAIVGEFQMGATDRGMFHAGLVTAPDQGERARMYQDYIRSVVDHPLFVGCHYFKFTDEPLTGRELDGENYATGFASVSDDPYPELLFAAQAVHLEVYQRRMPTLR
jgi:hypothetical protein